MKMKANEEKIQALKEVLQMAKNNGYECWQIEENCIGETWGLMKTPLNNLLYIQFDYFGGFSFSLQYVPSRNNGSGCQCLKDAVSNVTIETLKEAEKQGLQFAHELNAILYNSAESALKRYDLSEYVKI